MKTKIWVGVLFYSFMGCANKAPKSNLTSKSIPKEPEGYGVRYIPVQEELVEENTVYEVVEEMPEFPGGINKLLQFINDNMKYPTKAQTEGMQGKVIVQFIIDEDGYIIEPNIVRSVESSLDNGLSGNFWLVSFKISYLCLPLFYETRTTPSCHPSGCAYRQL